MGCDIHLFSEKKKTVNGTEKWVNADYWKINPYFGTDEYESELELVSIYRNRNYNLIFLLRLEVTDLRYPNQEDYRMMSQML
jgi:hypothetical protein